MKHSLRWLVPFAVSMAVAAVFTFVPINLSVGSNGPVVTAGFRSACASPVRFGSSAVDDGSCKPHTHWICGLNGQNYPDKEYVAPS
jgi:hypothetical protein